MPGSQRFGNSGRVVHETIDGETILIHLDTGAYYSLDGAGADAWGLLNAGGSVDEVVAVLAARYEAGREEIEAAVADVVGHLQAEDLLTPAADVAPNGQVAAARAAAPAQRAAFEPPVLRKYTDMQEFLLVDPIHETDTTGWPNVKPVG